MIAIGLALWSLPVGLVVAGLELIAAAYVGAYWQAATSRARSMR